MLAQTRWIEYYHVNSADKADYWHHLINNDIIIMRKTQKALAY